MEKNDVALSGYTLYSYKYKQIIEGVKTMVDMIVVYLSNYRRRIVINKVITHRKDIVVNQDSEWKQYIVTGGIL